MSNQENDAIWQELKELRQEVEQLKVRREKVAEQVDELRDLHVNLLEEAERTERIIRELEALS